MIDYKKQKTGSGLFIEMLKTKGVKYLLLKSFYKIIFPIYLKIFRKNHYFTMGQDSYKYFYHQYNCCLGNERTVEIPIILKFINKFPYPEILEIGNVLSHYRNRNWDVIDKYEKSKHVLNLDAANVQLNRKYSLIFSISTFEHIGFDEKPKDPLKTLRAIKNLAKHLKRNGVFIITIPKGWNPYLDKYII
jgi:hypothetical protein